VRIAGRRTDGAFCLSLGSGLAVVLKGTSVTPTLDESVADAMGPWTPVENTFDARRLMQRVLDQARVVPAQMLLYSDAQPRADDGKWTDGGAGNSGGSKGKLTKTGKTPLGRKGPASKDRPGEVVLSPKDAYESMLNGEKVNIAKEDVRDFMKQARKHGGDPDLTDLHVEGHQIFGGNGLGIDRAKMPQIPKELRDDFLKETKAAGVKIKDEMVSPFTLAPTQTQISATNAGDKLKKFEDDPKRKFPALLVSQDGHLLDGHHHWGMIATVALDHPEIKVPIHRVMTTTQKGLDLMRAFDKKHGIKGKAIGAHDTYDDVIVLADVETV
jgi:hypothetical protein